MEYIYIAFLQGILAGIAIAFPKGPAGLLVITQTIRFGWRQGFAVAMGPIITTFISSFIVLLLTVFSINVQALEQVRHNLLVHVIGGCFLVVVGFYMVFFLKEKQVSTKNIFLYTFLEPFLFPTTIATFMWTSPDILTAPIFTKVYFFLGIISSTLVWYFVTIKLFEFITRKGFKKIEMVNIFFGSIFIVLGFILIIITNYEVISTFWGLFFCLIYILK